MDRVDQALERFTEKLDSIDTILGDTFDDRINALREELECKKEIVDDIRNGSEPEPELEPTPQPEPEPKPKFTAEDFQGEGETVVVIDTGWNTQFIGDQEPIVFDYDFQSEDDNAQV